MDAPTDTPRVAAMIARFKYELAEKDRRIAELECIRLAQERTIADLQALLINTSDAIVQIARGA